MTMPVVTATSDARYPVGRRPSLRQSLSEPERNAAIDSLAAAPNALRDAIAGLSYAQLDTPYRENGWTVRQVVHHLADAHAHAYLRFRLAIAEPIAAVIPFDEARWAELRDALSGPITPSLFMFDGMHQRLDVLLRAIEPDVFSRAIRHPTLGVITVDTLLMIFEWHARHHTGQIIALRARNAWVDDGRRHD